MTAVEALAGDGRGGQAAVGVLRAARLARGSRCSRRRSRRPASSAPWWCSTSSAATSAPPPRRTPTPTSTRRSPLAVDAITASPFLGVGSLDPMFDTAARPRRRGLRARADLQPRGAAGAARPHRRRADGRRRPCSPRSRARNAGADAAGLVRGGRRRHDRRHRARTSTSTARCWCPGVGAQGGTADDVRRIFGARRQVLPSSSREILGAGPDATRAARRRARAERRLRGAGPVSRRRRAAPRDAGVRAACVAARSRCSALARGCSDEDEDYCDALRRRAGRRSTELADAAQAGGERRPDPDPGVLRAAAGGGTRGAAGRVGHAGVRLPGRWPRPWSEAGIDPADYDAGRAARGVSRAASARPAGRVAAKLGVAAGGARPRRASRTTPTRSATCDFTG